MAYIQGEGRGQGTLFPVMLDDFVPIDHVCRVIDAFVVRLDVAFNFKWRGVSELFGVMFQDYLA
jgi:hypothetical protein